MEIKGFRFSAVEAAIKKPGRRDLALIFSETPATACAVFTVNSVKAAPVLLSMERVKRGTAEAMVVNSGNANACTGDQGMVAAEETARLVAEGLGIDEKSVLVSSTGVIGVPMPMDRVRGAIPPLVGGLASGTLDDVARAIMTTDTFPKLEARTAQVDGTAYSVAGIAKGSGMIMPNMATMLSFVISDAAVEPCFLESMIMPNMATMLSFVISDAAVEPCFLEKVFRRAVDASFNSITVDGDMSTNDTCLLLANGMAGNRVIREGTEEAAVFEGLLNDVLLSLAKLIARDGEGATKFVEVRVSGARNDGDARKAAFAIANSCLVKTAFYGQDANWGRIFAAVGYSGAEVDQGRLSLCFDDVCMARDGVFAGGDAEQLGTAVLRRKEFSVSVDLGLGNGTATVFTSDLSHDYVSINADYRT